GAVACATDRGRAWRRTALRGSRRRRCLLCAGAARGGGRGHARSANSRVTVWRAPHGRSPAAFALFSLFSAGSDQAIRSVPRRGGASVGAAAAGGSLLRTRGAPTRRGRGVALGFGCGLARCAARLDPARLSFQHLAAAVGLL